MNSSMKKETRLFNLMKKLRDRKRKKKKRKKNLLSFQGPSPLVCPISIGYRAPVRVSKVHHTNAKVMKHDTLPFVVVLI
jgi:hypothetical protein